MKKVTIELDNDLAQKVEKLVDSHTNKNILFERFISNYREEIERKIAKIDKDLKKYEAKHNMSSEAFHEKFEKGEVGDSTDVML